MDLEAKQVIVMRKFPGLRTGKYVAQGSHASLGALLSMASKTGNTLTIPLDDPYVHAWLTQRFKKITVYVKTEQELLEIHDQAVAAGLPCALIRDAGLTEFGGVPTLTSVAIGPANPVEIDKITGNLSLF